MNIDSINNSQLILLVLLITVITSAAISIATLSIIYQRLPVADQTNPKQTVIKQTVNKIIEREKIITNDTNKPENNEEITLEDIENAFVKIHFGSQPITSGLFIDSKGLIVVPEILHENRIYNLFQGETQTQFATTYIGNNHSILKPINDYESKSFITIAKDKERVHLGESIFIYGGFGETIKIHSEIISQKRERKGATQIRTSANPSDISLPSAIFLNDKIIGFISDYSGWSTILAEEISENTQG